MKKKNLKNTLKVSAIAATAAIIVLVSDNALQNALSDKSKINSSKEKSNPITIEASTVSNYFGYGEEINKIVNSKLSELTNDGFNAESIKVVEDKIFFMSSVENQLNWFDAMRFANEHNCRLASISNEEEYCVLKMALQSYDINYYLGIYTGNIGNEWINIDRSEASYVIRKGIVNTLVDGAVLTFNGYNNTYESSSYAEKRPFIIEYTMR